MVNSPHTKPSADYKEGTLTCTERCTTCQAIAERSPSKMCVICGGILVGSGMRSWQNTEHVYIFGLTTKFPFILKRVIRRHGGWVR